MEAEIAFGILAAIVHDMNNRAKEGFFARNLCRWTRSVQEMNKNDRAGAEVGRERAAGSFLPS
jgi:hypothetical protein